MTLKELKEEVGLALENKPQEWRVGQFVFNYMERWYGDVARKTQFVDGIDCFFRDDKVDEFLEACLKRINTTNI